MYTYRFVIKFTPKAGVNYNLVQYSTLLAVVFRQQEQIGKIFAT